MNDFLKKLDINVKGETSPTGVFTADLTEDEWQSILSKLDRSLEEDVETSSLTAESMKSAYYDETHDVLLEADLQNDTYKLTITEIGDN